MFPLIAGAILGPSDTRSDAFNGWALQLQQALPQTQTIARVSILRKRKDLCGCVSEQWTLLLRCLGLPSTVSDTNKLLAVVTRSAEISHCVAGPPVVKEKSAQVNDPLYTFCII